MKHLSTVLILILASTNASKYFGPEHQQNAVPKNAYQDMIPFAFDEDRFLSKLSSTEDLTNKWEPPPDPRVALLADLEILENLLQDEPEDLRIKRMKTSLSIDNPLDVLRQQYYRALARRMKVQSIEKNREHLIKAGKRSPKESNYRLSLSKPMDFPLKATKKNFLENGFGESERYSVSSNEQNPTTRGYKSRLEDISYQT